MTNQITFFERRLINLEERIGASANSVGVGEPGDQPEEMLQKMVERIKTLEGQVQTMTGDSETAILFSPTIHHVIDKSVDRYLVPRLAEGVDGYALLDDRVAQYEGDIEVMSYPYAPTGVNQKTLTPEEWSYLLDRIKVKIETVYTMSGVTRITNTAPSLGYSSR